MSTDRQPTVADNTFPEVRALIARLPDASDLMVPVSTLESLIAVVDHLRSRLTEVERQRDAAYNLADGVGEQLRSPARWLTATPPPGRQPHEHTDRQYLDAEISFVTWPGCCRAAVDSDGHTHDHAEWFAEVQQLRARLAEVEAERDAVRAELADARSALDGNCRELNDLAREYEHYHRLVLDQRAVLERAMPVVEAARAWCSHLGRNREVMVFGAIIGTQIKALLAAVDTYQEAP